MKQIPLTKGQFALVDDDDFERVNQFKWYAWYCKDTQSYYAMRDNRNSINGRIIIRMHRFIINPPKNKEIDHIDHNTLNNQKSNLRIVNKSQNALNGFKKRKICSSIYKGVNLCTDKKHFGHWRAYFKGNWIGRYKTEKEAALAYNKTAFSYDPVHCLLNDIH